MGISLGLIFLFLSYFQILDKVHMQFQSFLDDPMYTDQHALHVEVIRTFARVGPNAEPKFRDECKYQILSTVVIVA